MEHAATRFAVLTAAAVSLLCLAAPALAAPGPEPSPRGGSGPQPDPSGGRARVQAAAPVVIAAPRVSVVRTASPTARRQPHAAKPDRRRVHLAVPAPLAPRSAPSAVFNSLRSAAQVPGRAVTAGGIDSQKFALAAAALLMLALLCGSLLLLETQSARNP